MTTKESCNILAEAKIRPTSIRILTYKAATELARAFCLSDLEEHLPTIDKSSIFRALTLFHEHNLIHQIDDGSGSRKYCLCQNHGECLENEGHAHFTCENCGKTFCLKGYVLPHMDIPKDCIIREINLVMKGLCSECSSKKK